MFHISWSLQPWGLSILGRCRYRKAEKRASQFNTAVKCLLCFLFVMQFSRLSSSSLWQRLRREFIYLLFFICHQHTTRRTNMSINLHWLHLHFYRNLSKNRNSSNSARPDSYRALWKGCGGGLGGGMRLLWKAARASMHTQTSCDSASPGLLWLKPDLLLSFFLSTFINIYATIHAQRHTWLQRSGFRSPPRFIPAWRHLRTRHAGQFFLRILSMMQSFLPAHK